MILLYELLKILVLEENIKIYDNGYNHCLYEGGVSGVIWSLCTYQVVGLYSDDGTLMICIEKDKKRLEGWHFLR